MIKHIVMWNLVGDKQDAAEFLMKTFAQMPAQIPEVIDMQCGPALASQYTNRDFALITTHHSAQDLYAYQQCEAHKAITALVKPYLSDRVCVDFEL